MLLDINKSILKVHIPTIKNILCESLHFISGLVNSYIANVRVYPKRSAQHFFY